MSAPSTILHKRSYISSIVPATTSLSAGEIAVNVADGKLFTKTTDNSVKTFLNAEQHPYTLNTTLSSVNYQYGANTVTGILAGVLGGVGNDISGAGSTIINGSDNSINADYAFIGNGANNTILSSGDFGAILGGQNNTLNHPESFILGSNINSHLSGFTYVNNLSVLGKIYGNGSELTGITGGGGGAGDENVNTLVRSNSATWQATSTIVAANSGMWSPVRKFDMVYSPNTISYSGTAPQGSLTSQNVWTIVRIIFTTSGTVSAEGTASNVAWNNRLIATYV